MAVDLNVSGLRLTQSMPIMKPILLHTEASLVIPNASSDLFALKLPSGSNPIMPFDGKMVFQGSANIQVNAAGVQAVDNIWVSSSSSPAPTLAPDTGGWRSEGGPDVAIGSMPVIASWTGVLSGSVQLRVFIRCGSGGPSITLLRVSGILFCTKT